MHVFYASSANISGETKTIYIFDKEFLESLVMESGPKELSYLQSALVIIYHYKKAYVTEIQINI